MEKKFTENLIELCESKNLSQSELATKIGINQSQVSRYLKGVLPDLKTVVKICDFFECSIDYIVGLNEMQTYKNMKKGFNSQDFYNKYEKLLNQNNTTHYQLAKKHLVCETSLRLWKKGTLPKLEALYNIANELSSSIDELLGRI